MILINLLPPEFRKSFADRPPVWATSPVAKGVGIFFLGLTLVFYIQYLLNLRTFGVLKTRWTQLQGNVQRVSQIKKEIEGGIKSEKEFLEHYVASPLPTTSILSSASQLLPDSIWLVELKVARQPKENTVLLKGLSRPSQRDSSIQDIEKYLRSLKEHFPRETNVVLTTSRQQKEKLELTLFTAIFKWS